MKIRMLGLVVVFVILWASPAYGVELDELPEFKYEIQGHKIYCPPALNKNTFYFFKKIDSWTKEDAYWQVAVLLTQFIDYRQTMNLVKYQNTRIYNSDGSIYHFPHDKDELNPFLGERPTEEAVKKYFISYAILGYIVPRLSPKKWRRWEQVFLFRTQINIIDSNYEFGLSLGF